MVRAVASTGEQLLRFARVGEKVAPGQLPEGRRSYLTLFSRFQVGRRFQSKVNPSDLVQRRFRCGQPAPVEAPEPEREKSTEPKSTRTAATQQTGRTTERLRRIHVRSRRRDYSFRTVHNKGGEHNG